MILQMLDKNNIANFSPNRGEYIFKMYLMSGINLFFKVQFLGKNFFFIWLYYFCFNLNCGIVLDITFRQLLIF